MTNYDLLNDERIKYLYYLCEHIKRIDMSVKNIFDNRDMKLELLIGEDNLHRVKEELDSEITRIKNKLNDFDITDLNSLVISEMEKIATSINKLKAYLDYVIDNMNKTYNIEID